MLKVNLMVCRKCQQVFSLTAGIECPMCHSPLYMSVFVEEAAQHRKELLMATNLALVSLTDNVKRTTADVKRIQKAYDSLQNKSTKYALDHQALLMAYKEVLAVYVRHLKAAEQSFAPDSPYFCGECGTRANLPHHSRCSHFQSGGG